MLQDNNKQGGRKMSLTSQGNSRGSRTKKLCICALMLALAFILSYLESLLPPFTGIPGVKPGLANIVTMVCLYVLDIRYAAAVAIVRVILSGLTFSGMSTIIYGLFGSIFCLIVMFLLSRKKIRHMFSVPAVSVAGAVSHNAGQLLAARLVLGGSIIYYFPVLVVSGLAAGLITGIIAGLIIPRLSLLR